MPKDQTPVHLNVSFQKSVRLIGRLKQGKISLRLVNFLDLFKSFRLKMVKLLHITHVKWTCLPLYIALSSYCAPFKPVAVHAAVESHRCQAITMVVRGFLGERK